MGEAGEIGETKLIDNGELTMRKQGKSGKRRK
jgi:hypothetical protein